MDRHKFAYTMFHVPGFRCSRIASLRILSSVWRDGSCQKITYQDASGYVCQQETLNCIGITIQAISEVGDAIHDSDRGSTLAVSHSRTALGTNLWTTITCSRARYRGRRKEPLL
jgi:hypothetical protein